MISAAFNPATSRLLVVALSHIILAAGMADAASAACADMWAAKFTGAPPTRCSKNTSTCTDGSDSRPAVFHAGDQVTVCVKLPYDAYITLWDAAPNGGNVHRMYPNVLTHRDNGTVLGEKMSGASQYCFGHQDFPMYFPRSKGLGEGKLTIFATPTLEGQPTFRDMKVPGEEMERPRHEMIAQTLTAATDCHMPYSHQIRYSVIE
jgi:hypothetical protein